MSEHATNSSTPQDDSAADKRPKLNRELDKDGAEIAKGVAIEALPNAMFKVVLDDTGEEILAYLSGKMKRFRIRVLVGDGVRVKLDPYGGKARIITRL